MRGGGQEPRREEKLREEHQPDGHSRCEQCEQERLLTEIKTKLEIENQEKIEPAAILFSRPPARDSARREAELREEQQPDGHSRCEE